MKIQPRGAVAGEASFERPLALLAACHDRVAKQCATLLRLPDYVQAHGVDSEVRLAVQRVQRYFDGAAVQHHADEEHDLFPALRAAVPAADAARLEALLRDLVAQHRALEAAWKEMRAALRGLIEEPDQPLTAERITGFVHAYTAHTTQEDADLLPWAQALLSAAELATLGEAMQRRRGLKADGAQTK